MILSHLFADDTNLDDDDDIVIVGDVLLLLLSTSFIIIVEDFLITARKQIMVIMYADMHIALVYLGIDMEPK